MNEEEIEEFVGQSVPEGSILGSYIVLAEVLSSDPDEGTSLVVASSKGLPVWVAMGMLGYGQVYADSQVDADFDFDEEDGEY